MLHYILEILTHLLNRPSAMYTSIVEAIVYSDVQNLIEDVSSIRVSIGGKDVVISKDVYAVVVDNDAKNKIILTEHVSHYELYDLVDILRFKATLT